MVIWFFPEALSGETRGNSIRALTVVLMGCIALTATIVASNLRTSIISVALFNFAYECVWLHNTAEFFRRSPAPAVARLQFFFDSDRLHGNGGVNAVLFGINRALRFGSWRSFHRFRGFVSMAGDRRAIGPETLTGIHCLAGAQGDR